LGKKKTGYAPDTFKGVAMIWNEQVNGILDCVPLQSRLTWENLLVCTRLTKDRYGMKTCLESGRRVPKVERGNKV
jgi:hypothetical protein